MVVANINGLMQLGMREEEGGEGREGEEMGNRRERRGGGKEKGEREREGEREKGMPEW